jgi:hypothetical protein
MMKKQNAKKRKRPKRRQPKTCTYRSNKVDIKKFEPTKDNRPAVDQTTGGPGGPIHVLLQDVVDQNQPETSKEGISEKAIQDKIRSTMAKLQGTKGKSDRSKYRKTKRDDHAVRAEGEEQKPMYYNYRIYHCK